MLEEHIKENEIILEGKMVRGKRFWLAEVPALDLLTQARTDGELLSMVRDAIECLVYPDRVSLEVFVYAEGELKIVCAPRDAIERLIKKRQRGCRCDSSCS